MAVFSELFMRVIGEAGSHANTVDLIELENFHAWVSSQPKIETHVHLEAATGKEFYAALEHPPSWHERCPWDRVPFQNLRGFIDAWVDLSKSIRSLADFEKMAESFVAQRAAERIVYSEAYVSPADFSFIRKRFSIAEEVFSFEQVVRAYLRGLKKGLSVNPGIEVRLIVDSLWISTDEERELVHEGIKNIFDDGDAGCDAFGKPLIVGIGLGGMENHRFLEQQREFFAKMRALGLKIDIHSGEGGTAEIHKRSVESLQPDRVAHGIAGFEENILFSDNLVMCPLSNILLRTYQGPLNAHPVFECLRRNIPISIGSDDPLLLGNSLALEYTFIHAVTGQGYEAFTFTQKNARERVFAPGVLKRLDA
ncbi:MAG: hypothetical protein RI953_3062 [Pseudomonadota bacterium]|jgi:adenosine deaminase